MREIVQLSLGTHSNYISTHFWNAQDENLKVIPQILNQVHGAEESTVDEKLQEEIAQNIQMNYQELGTSGQLVARNIYMNFRENFGNYASCFFGHTNIYNQASQSHQIVTDIKNYSQNNLWKGGQTVQHDFHSQKIPMSKFQRELLEIDQIQQQQALYERGLDEDEDNNEDQDYINEKFRDDEDDEDYGEKKMIFQGAQGSTQNTTKDMFAQFFEKEQKKHLKHTQSQTLKQEIEMKKKKLDEIQNKQPSELYNYYNFDEDVRYFTDFMQSQMNEKYNQIFVPHNQITQDNFMFFSKGKEIWSLDSKFRDDIEDKVRLQLEICDLLQGFSLTVDINSGFGSLGNSIINNILKDESPKSPVQIYSVNNQQQLSISEQMNEEDIINMQTKQSLIDLNQSLFYSEIHENIELVVPFGQEIKLGKEISKFFNSYKKENIFHQSSLQTLIVQNIQNVLKEKYLQTCNDMTDFIRQSLYAGSPINILLPQIQLPIQNFQQERYLEKLQKTHINDKKYYINFNEHSKLHEKRFPLRHTFILQGANSLIQKKENPRIFKEQFDAFVFQNTKYERGFKSFLLNEPIYLPIPYPRYFTQGLVSQDGLLLEQDTSGFKNNKVQQQDQFLQQMPSLTKLLLDGSYLGYCEKIYKNLKCLSMKTRASLLKENDNMEHDEWKEKVNQLEILCENYRLLALSEEPSSSSDQGYDY